MPVRHGLVLVAALAGIAAAAPASLAQSPPPPAVKDGKPDLPPEELAEREQRKACKFAICAAFHNRKPGDDVTCNVLKTWRKEQLDAMVAKAKVSWPWGSVKCTADIKLKRADLAKAMTEPKHETVLDKHKVSCVVDRDKEAPAEIKFDFTPKVQFENGKAVKASLNWGAIEAPTLVKGAMWTATATDNTFNVLQGSVVEDINDFIGPKCDEVKADCQGK